MKNDELQLFENFKQNNQFVVYWRILNQMIRYICKKSVDSYIRKYGCSCIAILRTNSNNLVEVKSYI